jgi:hypothetical protein
MAKSFEEVTVELAADGEATYDFENAILMDNGWLKVDVPLDNGDVTEEYYPPHAVRRFYVP